MCICIFLRICFKRLKRIWRRQKTLWNKVERLHVSSITHRMFSTIYDDYLLTICTLLAGSVFYGHLLWHNIFSRMHILILKCTSSLLYVPLYVLYGVYFSSHNVLTQILYMRTPTSIFHVPYIWYCLHVWCWFESSCQ